MKIPDPIKSGIATASFSFVFLFIPAVLGFFTQLGEWASSSGQKPLPEVSSLGYAFVAAASAAVIGLGTTLFRWLQGKYDFIPGKPPVFQGK